jgi:hypothetical protein
MKIGGENIFWPLAFEFAPAAMFGSAVGFATATWLRLPPFEMTPVAAGAAAFGAVWLGLYKFASREAFPLKEFEQPEVEFQLSPMGELLEQADVAAIVDRLGSVSAHEEPKPEVLELDDVLAAIEPESRVVQLFEANDTAGEMQARIDRHLRSSPREVPDATQELHDALAALRRSLR